MKFYNYTNHTITIYNAATLVPDSRRNNDYFTRANIQPEILIEIPQSGRPLNAHDLPGVVQSLKFDDITFHHPKITSVRPDPFPVALDPSAIYIVSSHYAEYGSQLPFNIFDALYIPEGRVYAFDDSAKRKIVGCIGLRKIKKYENPSIYLQAVEGIGLQPSLITVQCAMHYWQQRYYQLSVPEQLALHALEITMTREVSVCH